MRSQLAQEFQANFPGLVRDKAELDRLFLEILPSPSGTNKLLIEQSQQLWLYHYERIYPFLWTHYSVCFTSAQDRIYQVGLGLDVLSRFLWLLLQVQSEKGDGLPDNKDPGITLLVADGLFTLFLEYVSDLVVDSSVSDQVKNYFYKLFTQEVFFPDYLGQPTPNREDEGRPDSKLGSKYHSEMEKLLLFSVEGCLTDDDQVVQTLREYLRVLSTHRQQSRSKEDFQKLPSNLLNNKNSGIGQCFVILTDYHHWLLSHDLCP